MPHPTATIFLSTGGVIGLELYPEVAPQAVASFLHLARKGVFDRQCIERIVPGWVVDVSYHAFHNPAACYFIPNDTEGGTYLPAQFGTVGLGGYGRPDIAGGEFFFPLADCPAITGKYPIFGKVTRGLSELRRLEQVETTPVSYPGLPEVQINTPVEPIWLERVTVETYGVDYGRPVRLTGVEKPYFWPCLSEIE